MHGILILDLEYLGKTGIISHASLKRESIKVEKNKLLWQKAGLSAVSIKKQYDDAKEEYKGKKMSVTEVTTRQKSAP